MLTRICTRSNAAGFLGFSAMMARFVKQTVMNLWTVRELALRHKSSSAAQKAKGRAIRSGVFNVFVEKRICDIRVRLKNSRIFGSYSKINYLCSGEIDN